MVGDLKAASSTADPAERAGSVFRLAMHLQDLHRDLSVSAAYAARGENVAGQDQRLRDTIAVGMVVGEATRGVLGLAPRREGALNAAAADTVGKAVTDQSTERITEVKKAVKEKRDEHEL